ncbi:hypothetical protein BRD09_08515 [Halobacteriales archaeon SW_10_68_16]|nr:MAG: hypothetical protein BRD09_08515 [Halobacteriales archaeon SW_10_68_16]
MGGIFPLRETVSLGEDRDPRLIELDEDVADEVFDALSSRTTRTIFAELHASPQTASDLAEVTDTSVQNAQYHLEKLVAADLVEVVDTWYSERGTEMKVYAPTDEALVLLAGEDTEGALRSLLKRVVGVLAVLLPGSAVVAILADRLTAPDSAQSFQSAGESAGAGAGTETAETEEEAAPRESSEEGAAEIAGWRRRPTQNRWTPKTRPCAATRRTGPGAMRRPTLLRHRKPPRGPSTPRPGRRRQG